MILREHCSQSGIRTIYLCPLVKLLETPSSTTCSYPSTSFRSDKKQKGLDDNPLSKRKDYIHHSVTRNHINLHRTLLLEMVEELGIVIHTAPITTTQTIRVDILEVDCREGEEVIAVLISRVDCRE